MDINKRSRSELKGYFQKNDIPTESNFAELIDGMLNQKDDGLARPAGDPLSIEAERDSNSLKKLLNFYGSFGDTGPSWSLCLNPRDKPGDPKTAAAGFGVIDGDGQVRLFIDRKTGNVGINTGFPTASLHVRGRNLQIDGGQVQAPGPLVLQAGSGNNLSPIQFISQAVLPNGQFAPAERMRIDIAGNVGIGTPGPAAPLDVQGVVRLGLEEGGSGTRSISFLRDRGRRCQCGENRLQGVWTSVAQHRRSGTGAAEAYHALGRRGGDGQADSVRGQ